VTKRTAAEFQDACRRRGLLGEATGKQRVRFVTHHGITAAGVQLALEICQDVMSA
jgi:threonine aldolase